MKPIEPVVLPEWIARQATLGLNVPVAVPLSDTNWFQFYLSASCPLIFEAYAIVLHPFWTDWQLTGVTQPDLLLEVNLPDKSNCHNRLSWNAFFNRYGFKFSPETARSTSEFIRNKLLEEGWPENIWFPEEGNCETDDIRLILNHLERMAGKKTICYFYDLLKTASCEERLFQGDLTSFEQLSSQEELYKNPSAIYAEDASWCIISDYDLPFTCVGGRKQWLEGLTRSERAEIILMNPF